MTWTGYMSVFGGYWGRDQCESEWDVDLEVDVGVR